MEWLLVIAILLLPVIRFVLLPAKVVGSIRRLPIGQMAIIGALLIAGWFAFQAVMSPREATGRYMRGDAEMRKLLVD